MVPQKLIFQLPSIEQPAFCSKTTIEMNKKHLFWMIIGCTVPLLLIFFAPALGLSEGTGLFLFILAMFACHLFMPHGHGHGHGQASGQGHSHNEKEETYERHSH